MILLSSKKTKLFNYSNLLTSCNSLTEISDCIKKKGGDITYSITFVKSPLVTEEEKHIASVLNLDIIFIQ